MDKVKALVNAGSSITGAIKEALRAPLSEVAARHRLNRASFTEQINGSRRPTDDTVDALIAELGGTREEWRELLWLAAKPEHVEPVRATA